MKAGWTISAVLHAGVLAWGLVSISAKPLDKPPTESLPVDIISASDFSQITKGTKNAPKAEAPRQLVEKVAGPVLIVNFQTVAEDCVRALGTERLHQPITDNLQIILGRNPAEMIEHEPFGPNRGALHLHTGVTGNEEHNFPRFSGTSG